MPAHSFAAVGITGELPSDGASDGGGGPQPRPPPDGGREGPSGAPAAALLEDPTERLAAALGLDINLLAHRRGSGGIAAVFPGAGAASAAKRLRHALSHPLVDPDAGARPDQHHAAATALSRARRRPRAQRRGAGAGAGAAAAGGRILEALQTRAAAVGNLESVATAIRGRLQVL
jgi:hypothetical protein